LTRAFEKKQRCLAIEKIFGCRLRIADFWFFSFGLGVVVAPNWSLPPALLPFT